MPYKKGRIAVADWKYVLRARRAGARHCIKIIEEARTAGLPLSWAFALVEQETAPLGSANSFRNIFGCDRGSILCHERVTRDKVKRLLRFIDQDGPSNGVGLTQLTWPPYIREAERKGGAHRPRIQLRVGFRVFRSITRESYSNAWRYNGAREYQGQIEAKQRKWHRILAG